MAITEILNGVVGLVPQAERGIPGPPADDLRVFATLGAATADPPPVSIGFVYVAGHHEIGKGACWWKRVATEPTHPGKIQFSDGSWWEHADTEITPLQIGASGNGTADDVDFLEAANTIMNARAIPLHLCSARYRCSRQLSLALRRTGNKVFGDGRQDSLISFDDGVASPNLLITCPTGDFFYSDVIDFGVRGKVNGVVVAMGSRDYHDPLNRIRARIVVNNDSTDGGAVAIEYNYLCLCTMDVTGNCASQLAGSAHRIRQACFSDFILSGGSAYIALQICDGFSFGNTFLNPNFEVVSYCISIESASASLNNFFGGTMVWNVRAINAVAGADNTFYNTNFGSDPANIFSASVGVEIKGSRSQIPIQTPAFALGTNFQNNTGKKILVEIFNGTVTGIVVNNQARSFAPVQGYLTRLIQPGDIIGVQGTGGVGWIWSAAD